MTTPWLRLLAMLATVAGVLAGTSACSGTTADAASISPASVAPEFTATASVIDRAETGPLLCLGGEYQSRPPGCAGGVPVIGWDWDVIDIEETKNGVTWGDYTVHGTWDGSALTLTRKPTSPDREAAGAIVNPIDISEDFASPCPAPLGGWSPVDPLRTTQSTFDSVTALAPSIAGYSHMWVDNSPAPPRAEHDITMEDPTQLVLNVAVTTDIAEAEAALRTVWGGALCVSSAEHTSVELEAIRVAATESVPEALGSGTDADSVAITVPFDDGTLQSRLDAEYGPRTVVVTSVLELA